METERGDLSHFIPEESDSNALNASRDENKDSPPADNGKEWTELLQSMGINEPTAQEKEKIQRDRDLREGQEKIREICGRMSRRLGVEIPEVEMPYLRYDQDVNKIRNSSGHYNREMNDIVFQDKKLLEDGPFLGEEIGHFIREYFHKPEVDSEGILKNGEILTDEFFGFLGRRILLDVVSDEEKQILFPDGVVDSEFDPASKEYKKKLVRDLKKVREALSQEEQIDIETKKLSASDLKKYKNFRLEALVHFRGYEFASKFDLNKITNWEKLLRMPNREVRMKFFKENPDYSGL